MDLLLYARKQVDDANAKSAKATENLQKEVTTLMEVLQLATKKLDVEKKASAKKDQELATMQELLMYARTQMDKEAAEKKELADRLSEMTAQLSDI